MSLVDTQDFRQRWVGKLETALGHVEQMTRDWPESERKASLVTLAELARQYPDLLGLAQRFEREAEGQPITPHLKRPNRRDNGPTR